MEEDSYRVKEYPNKEKGFIIDEEKFGKFSKDLFKFPIFGIIYGIYINIIYIISWRKKMSIISILIRLFIHYIIIKICLLKILNINEIK
jgi:hypothetical protein